MNQKTVLHRKETRKTSRATASHMPRLDTIQMVEDAISEAKEFDSKNKLWRALPKQVQYKTFITILDYLEKSNKIMYYKKSSILWIFADNPKIKKLHRESIVLS